MTSLVPYGDSDEDEDQTGISRNEEHAFQGVGKRKLEAFHGSNVEVSDKKSRVHTSLGILASDPLKGDWVSYCFIPVSQQERLSDVMLKAYDLLLARDDQAKVVADPHISLTKPILIRYHEKDSLVAKAKGGLADYVKAPTTRDRERISLAFSAFTHFKSEGGRRIYWAIEVGLGWQQLRSLATSISDRMSCFHAREYFREARFHCSFASTPDKGSTDRQINGIIDCLEQSLGNQLRACPALVIDKIVIATGSQEHHVNLNSVK